MANTGAINTGATLIVLIYSLYASYLLSWKFDAGPVLYFSIFVCAFLLLRTAVSPLIDMWSKLPSAQITADTEDPTMNADTCSALFMDPSKGNLMDAMTGYVKEPPSRGVCPIGFVPTPATNTDRPDPKLDIPAGSSFFHYCVPVKPSNPRAESSTPTSQAASNNRYMIYSEY